jgi:hypothetical protein
MITDYQGEYFVLGKMPYFVPMHGANGNERQVKEIKKNG